ncbi:MAG: C40 family peptidase [Tetrasphaera jenkinsii]|nr:C40 family peptidase [Tetrasphaera jenkinsii]
MSFASSRLRASRLPVLVGSRENAGARAGVVVAATGALVAAFAGPAHAATTPAAVPAAPVRVAAAPAVASAAPAVTAPRAAAPLRTAFGVIGVKAVAKPKPKPKPVVNTVVTAPAAAATTATTAGAPATSSNPAPATTNTPAPSTPAPSQPAASGVLAIAASLSGIPYVYGGSTPAGFDCSGFTMYIFAKVGISLPRTAAGQQAAATPVSNPQPGDLVFFGYPAYHVGIYAGNGMMYDSPRTGLSSGLRAIWSSSATYGRP